MRTLAIGDIHGCYRSLKLLADVVRLSADDQLMTLGDAVDRGPESAAVVDWLIEQHNSGRCLSLRGNHETMMLAALQGQMPMVPWLQFGGSDTLASYQHRGGPGALHGIPLEHLTFLHDRLLPYHETERFIFVHATAAPHLPLNEQSEESLYWDRFETQKPHDSGKLVICGHTAQKSGLPKVAPGAICIDTWCYGGGWLTCLDVETLTYWQANERGETRSGQLDLPPR
ncbi:metallophosphoesterase family protein [Planctomicrobium sp. SH664]|uniref:metallophosphoesterase family protein n=1 Tax=Planctomicrobium sp. SH664 TaxID=3448125 RepID=UPI003F5AF54A